MGYRRVELDDEARTVRLPLAGMALGLGAARLRALGVDRFLLSAGGQVMAAGTRDGRPWRVGIRGPRGGANDHFAVVEAQDLSVSTSGDYERFFVSDGVRYHHIVDPRSGWPSRGARSATAVSPDATLADALSTALMVLGPTDGLAVLAELRAAGHDVEGLVVDDHGRVHTSPGLAARLRLRHAPNR